MSRTGMGVIIFAVSLAAAGCSGGSHVLGSSSVASPTAATDSGVPSALSTTPLAPTSTSPTSPSAPSTSSAGSSSLSGQWTSYHATNARTGAVAAMPALDPASRAWETNLGGAVYGQVLAGDGRLLAVTEQDRVVALSPATGAVQGCRSLGAPVSNVSAVAGCGDIDPLGITSTPVLDPRTGTLYVVGEILGADGVVHHQLLGLDAATGAVRVSDDVDPPLPAGESAAQLLQRAGLALADGRVYVAYGGNDGDCGHYHGWVVGVAETGAPHEVSFEVASDGEGGAIWEAGGAPAIDAAGELFVSTGNANPDPPQGGPDPKAFTESVVKLSPTLQPLASFKDRVAGGDEDLATGNPVLLPDGNLFAIGKTDIGYVLTQRSLTEVAAIHGLCGSDPDGGPAFDAARDVMFVPCKGGGIQEVDLAHDRAGPVLLGSNGAPILIGDRLWAADYFSVSVTEYDATSGRQLQVLDTGTKLPTFASPSVGDGLLLIGTRTGVVAYR